MVQKAKKVPNTADRLKALNDHKTTLYALNRFNQSPVTSSTAFFANNGGSAGGSTSAAGNFLRTEGDTMVGPIAYYPVTVLINGSDELDISPTPANPQSSSYVIASFSSPDKIQLIKGATFAGQQLWLQVPASSTLTMEDYSNNAGGNVVTSDGDDIVITTTTDPVTFTLIFDVTLGPNGNNGGWVILNAKSITGGSTGGIAYPIQPTVTDFGAGWTGTEELNLNTGDGHIFKWTVDQDLTFDTSVVGVPTSGSQRTFESEFVHDEVGGTFTVTLPTSPSFVDEDGAVLASFTLATGRAILSCRVNEGTSGDIIVLQKNVAAAAAPSGATRELDNLTTTAINATLIPDTDVAYDLGSSAASWDSVWNRYIRFDTDVAAPSSSQSHKISTGTVGMHFNVNNSADKFVFYHDGTSSTDIDSSGLSVVDSVTIGDGTSGQGKVILNDSTATISPANGYVYREGNDVKVYSGGSERNLSDIGVAAGGANVALSNLSTTSVNQNLVPQAGKLLGDSGNPWSALWANNAKFGTAGVIDSTISQIAGTTPGMVANVPATKTYDFRVADINQITFSAGGIITSKGLITTGALGALALGDTTSYPGFNGAIYREGSDVKIYTGGSEVNVSTLGSGTPPFNDNVALLQDEIDNTKTLTFNLSLNSTGDANLITSSTTASRTWTLPDASTTLAGLATSQTFTGATNTFANDVAFEDDVTLGASSADNIDFNGQMISDIKYEFGFTTNFNESQSSVGSAGSATDLPSKPTGYIVIKVTDTEYVVPYYEKS